MAKIECRICGCSENDPCSHPEHGNCSWVEPELCSHCVMIQDGTISKDEITPCKANKNKIIAHVEFEICLQVERDPNGRLLISTSTNPEGICPEEVNKAIKMLNTNIKLKRNS